jgi:uncharacterized membrane protein
MPPRGPIMSIGSRLRDSVSVAGLLLGTFLFVASLTPTLVPRTFLMQGALSGVCFAAGYGLGLLFRWLWAAMELPQMPERILRPAKAVVAVLCLAAAVLALRQAAEWQNSVRERMQLEPVSTAHPLEICLVAAATIALLVVLALLFGLAFRVVSRTARRFVPRRISNLIGFAFAVLLFWGVTSGIVFRVGMHMLDASFAAQDALIDPASTKPASPLKTGSAASLVKWAELGRAGREFVSMGPTAAEISDLTGRSALEPIRVYVGLAAADTAKERAALALAELKRVHGFDRSVLIVVTPTGTGWVDPAAMDSVEYLHGGDVTSVAVQYSYLSSPLSLIAEPDYGEDAARALFEAIYGYWTTLPRDHRPKLFLHGLSLGSLNSEKSVQLFEILGDPINGALWSGPPFKNRLWRSIVQQRNGGSPAWLPKFHDGSYIRFMNQDGGTVPPGTPWGPVRIVYLQYASDAVTFFDYRDLYREPDWMRVPRGPDVSPELRWYPVVTMLQLAFDMAVATTTPSGFGHVFAPQHYVEAWMAVTDVRGWSDEQVAALKQRLAADPKWSAEDPQHTVYEHRGG